MKDIDAREFNKLRKEKPDLMVIDVRKTDEREEMCIPNTQHLVLDSLLDGEWDTLLKDKNQQIIVHCHAGIRSARAVEYLELEGFTDVYNLRGGIMAYVEAGLPLAE